MIVSDKLTDEQKNTITKRAIDVVYEDALQNSDYLYYIVSQWIKNMDTQDQIDVISSDEDIVKEFFQFDPSTA